MWVAWLRCGCAGCWSVQQQALGVGRCDAHKQGALAWHQSTQHSMYSNVYIYSWQCGGLHVSWQGVQMQGGFGGGDQGAGKLRLLLAIGLVCRHNKHIAVASRFVQRLQLLWH